ncbi:XRE family transcriptional regulator [Brevibacillus formosus]|nr:XRE family transcriptional regulator [Brevibacillus formosus]
MDALLEEYNDGRPDNEKLTRGAIAREAKVRPNAVYEMFDNETKRIDLRTFNKILDTIGKMTGREIAIQDVLEYVPGSPEE